MFAQSLEFELEKLAFTLKEPSSEPSHFVDWKDEPGKAEHGTIVVPWVPPAEVGANVSELVEAGQVRHWGLLVRESPRRSAGLGRRASRDTVPS